MARPRRMADVLSELLARSGCARVQATANLDEAWREAAGEALAEYTRPGRIRRGVLEIMTAHSPLIQEMTFRKQQLLAKLLERLPDQGIRDLRFRLGAIE